MKVWIEQGVSWNLMYRAAEGFRQVIKAAKQDIFITSGREGDHRPDSLHYLGRAWDMRKSGFTKAKLKRILGKDWDVIQYSWGFHVELDPK